MRRTTAVSFALSMILVGSMAAKAHPAAAAKDTKKIAVSADGWPDTRAGQAARGWVEAFSSGEAAMREYVTRELAPGSLAQRSANARVESYRKLREKYGKLVLASVVKSTPDTLTAKLMASDASLHEFVFTVQAEAPYKLVSVGIRERHGMHGGFGGFHH